MGGYTPLIPALLLVAGGVLLLVLPAVSGTRALAGLLAAAALAGAAIVLASLGHGGDDVADFLVFDNWSNTTIAATIALGLAFIVLVSGEPETEPAGLLGRLLVALGGVAATVVADHAAFAWLAISLAVLPLLAIPPQMVQSVTAKPPERLAPFLLLALGLVAIGLVLLCTAYGTAEFPTIRRTVLMSTSDSVPTAAVAGIGFVICGIAIILAAAPLHHWSSEAHDLSGPVGAAMIGAVSILGGYAALVRIVVVPLAGEKSGFGLASPVATLLWVFSVGSAMLGSLLACRQDRLRRAISLLATGQIGHMLGALAIGALAISPTARPAVTGWSAAAIQANIVVACLLGVYCTLSWLETPKCRFDQLDDLNGIGHTEPVASACLIACMAGLIGLPPFAGFWGKATQLLAAMTATANPFLAITVAIVTIASVGIQAVVFARVCAAVNRQTTNHSPATARHIGPLAIAMAIAATIVVLGMWPTPILQLLSHRQIAP